MRLDLKDSPDPKDPLDAMDKSDLKVTAVHLVLPVPTDPWDNLDPLDLPDLLENKVALERLANLEYKETPDPKVPVDPSELSVKPEARETSVPAENEARKVTADSKDPRVTPVSPDPLENLAPLVFLDNPDPEETLEPAVSWDPLDPPVKLVSPEPLDLAAPPERLEPLDPAVTPVPPVLPDPLDPPRPSCGLRPPPERVMSKATSPWTLPSTRTTASSEPSNSSTTLLKRSARPLVSPDPTLPAPASTYTSLLKPTDKFSTAACTGLTPTPAAKLTPSRSNATSTATRTSRPAYTLLKDSSTSTPTSGLTPDNTSGGLTWTAACLSATTLLTSNVFLALTMPAKSPSSDSSLARFVKRLNTLARAAMLT